MQVRVETVRTVFFNMTEDEAADILEGVNQHLGTGQPGEFEADDGILTMFQFRDQLLNAIRAKGRPKI